MRANGLSLLVLVGSRARGDARAGSDWDFGLLSDSGFDVEAFLGELVSLLGNERIDLVDLRRAGALFRFRAARDGIPLHQAEPGNFDRFWLEAVSFWCDVEPVLRPAYDALLDEFSR